MRQEERAVSEHDANRRFVLQIISNQNATWQGTVTWMDSNRQESFRSALEMIKLLDSAVEENQ